MGPEHDEELVSESAIRAASRAFDESYHHGCDELLAALHAASPVIRAHEHRVLKARIQKEAETVLDPAFAAGLLRALDILHGRETNLRRDQS